MFNNQYGTYTNPLLNNMQQPNFAYNQYPKSNGNYFYVNGVEGAKAFLISQPNTTTVLFDSDSADFFIKSTNMQGQATLKRFEYKEKPLNDNDNTKQNQPINMDDYVSKKEFEAFKNQFTKPTPIQQQMNTLKTEVNNNVQSNANNSNNAKWQEPTTNGFNQYAK